MCRRRRPLTEGTPRPRARCAQGQRECASKLSGRGLPPSAKRPEATTRAHGSRPARGAALARTCSAASLELPLTPAYELQPLPPRPPGRAAPRSDQQGWGVASRLGSLTR
eukprot:scaffold10326_cov31-Tisochrysis_lutea.AAC.4